MADRNFTVKSLEEIIGTIPTYTQTFTTASRTVDNLTSAALTDNGGGVAADGTIAEIADVVTAVADAAASNITLSTTDTYTDAAVKLAVDDGIDAIDTAIRATVDTAVDTVVNATIQLVSDAVKELSDQVNKLIVDAAADKKVITNLIDDLQAYGFVL